MCPSVFEQTGKFRAQRLFWIVDGFFFDLGMEMVY